MTREQYVRMTSRMRALSNRLPGGAKAFRLPTYLCAMAYIAALFHLMFLQDIRLVRALIVPAVCFGVVTLLRPIIGKQRPYDRLNAAPVGAYEPGKGKSMPSRHTASAAVIALTVAWLYPVWPVMLCMGALCVTVASLRVLCGQHDVSDVAAALLLSSAISFLGFVI